jgi:hypothetical protein
VTSRPATVSELNAGAEKAAREAPDVPMEGLAALRVAFPPTQVGKLPKGGMELDYVGHGAVTHRLLDVDPEWSWEPLAFGADGLPVFTLDANGNPIAFWIRLTVCGVTRLGCGTCRAGQFDAEKVLIGDAIRNAAMRFGVALDLWIRGHAEDDEKVSNEDDRSGPSRAIGWGKDEAKAHVLKLADGNADRAKEAWTAIYRTPWTPDALTAAYEAWVEQPKDPAGEGDTSE